MQHIRMELDPQLIPRCFSTAFSKGLAVAACFPCSVRELVCGQLGIPEDYLENRVQTLFLDGKPVDDVNTAMVEENASLALSAAMPGLAGAVLRKGGYYASLRKSISHAAGEAAARVCEGRIVVKLFNLTVREIGPLLLKRGVWMDTADFNRMVNIYFESLQAGCREICLNEQAVEIDALLNVKGGESQVYLQVG